MLNTRMRTIERRPQGNTRKVEVFVCVAICEGFVGWEITEFGGVCGDGLGARGEWESGRVREF